MVFCESAPVVSDDLAISIRKARGRSSAASAEGAMVQAQRAHTGATQRAPDAEGARCSSTEGEHATYRKDWHWIVIRRLSNEDKMKLGLCGQR